MAMLDARAFWRRYGCGATVFDAMGRELDKVVACNLETGEVIMNETRPWVSWLLGCRFERRPFIQLRNEVIKRHGFWQIGRAHV